MAEPYNGTNPVLRMIHGAKLEIMVALFLCAYYIKSVATSQLIQDKLCLDGFGRDELYCLNLAKATNSATRDKILAKGAVYGMAREAMILIPIVISSLYTGSWCDRFLSARRLVMLSCMVASIVECALLVVSTYFFHEISAFNTLYTFLVASLFGNSFSLAIANYSYISANHETDKKSFRFITVAVSNYVGTTIGSAAGGFLLNLPPSFSFDTMRNYTAIWVMSAAILLINIIFIIVFMKEYPIGSEREPLLSTPDQSIASPSSSSSQSQHVSGDGCCPKEGSIFSLNHIYDIVITLFKKRTRGDRKKLWWIMLVINLVLIPYLGLSGIAFPFVQKLYNWSAVEYSFYVTISTTIRPLALLFIIPFILRIFKMNDIQTSILGIFCNFLACLAIGTITTPLGYYISIIVGMVAALAQIGLRAYMSKILPKDEVSKMFSVLLTFEAMQPFVANLIMTTIFKYTIDWYPTMAYHVTALILIVSLSILAVIDCWDQRKGYIPGKPKHLSRMDPSSGASTKATKAPTSEQT